MSNKQKRLVARAQVWFTAVNALLEAKGAPSLGAPDAHRIFFEETEEGECLIVNISNAFVLCFYNVTAKPVIEVMLSVNRSEGCMSPHKTAVLTNVLTSAKVNNFSQLCVGAPFEIVDGVMIGSDNYD